MQFDTKFQTAERKGTSEFGTHWGLSADTTPLAQRQQPAEHCAGWFHENEKHDAEKSAMRRVEIANRPRWEQINSRTVPICREKFQVAQPLSDRLAAGAASVIRHLRPIAVGFGWVLISGSR